MKGRSGPLLFVTIFTTTTIVKNRIIANRISIEMFMFVQKVFIRNWNVGVILGYSSIYNMAINIVNMKMSEGVMFSLFICWFGDNATKYANITSMPPM